ncbi:hypothetical protein BKA62DRAFT_689026 [Auriculariales sp. MPI-PUGE-AT-0066]|nr:hypothetical protein BKA62DRAFT_689026 [Auriculariales sp. MPI-PUGE-AT-0066]
MRTHRTSADDALSEILAPCLRSAAMFSACCSRTSLAAGAHHAAHLSNRAGRSVLACVDHMHARHESQFANIEPDHGPRGFKRRGLTPNYTQYRELEKLVAFQATKQSLKDVLDQLPELVNLEHVRRRKDVLHHLSCVLLNHRHWRPSDVEKICEAVELPAEAAVGAWQRALRHAFDPGVNAKHGASLPPIMPSEDLDDVLKVVERCVQAFEHSVSANLSTPYLNPFIFFKNLLINPTLPERDKYITRGVEAVIRRGDSEDNASFWQVKSHAEAFAFFARHKLKPVRLIRHESFHLFSTSFIESPFFPWPYTRQLFTQFKSAQLLLQLLQDYLDSVREIYYNCISPAGRLLLMPTKGDGSEYVRSLQRRLVDIADIVHQFAEYLDDFSRIHARLHGLYKLANHEAGMLRIRNDARRRYPRSQFAVRFAPGGIGDAILGVNRTLPNSSNDISSRVRRT